MINHQHQSTPHGTVSLDAWSFVHDNLSSRSLDRCWYTSELASFLDTLKFRIFGRYDLSGYVAGSLGWVVCELTALLAVVQQVVLEFGRIEGVVCSAAP